MDHAWSTIVESLPLVQTILDSRPQHNVQKPPGASPEHSSAAYSSPPATHLIPSIAMFYALSAVGFALLPFVALASPLAADSASTVTTLPLSNLVLTAVAGNLTSKEHGLHADGTVLTTLVTCTGTACDTGCVNSGLPTRSDTCLGLPAFNSVGIVSKFGEIPTYIVGVGPPGCQSFAQIPEINTCFTVNNGPFTDYLMQFTG